MPHIHSTDHCLYAELLPSGDVVLKCSHTNCPVLHFGDRTLYIEKLSHNPSPVGTPGCVCIKVNMKVPLRCDSQEKLELVGGYIKAAGCSCHHEHPQELLFEGGGLMDGD